MGTALFNIEDRDKPYWFVMQAYKQERNAEKALASKDDGLEYYIAKHYVMQNRNGKRRKYLVPVIRNIIFVHASHTKIIEFKEWHNFLQFKMWNKSTGLEYMIVRDDQMQDFIKISSQHEQDVQYYKPEEINLSKGTHVRIIGGQFDDVQGTFMKVKGKRSRQIVVIIPEILAASVEVDPEFIEVLPS